MNKKKLFLGLFIAPLVLLVLFSVIIEYTIYVTTKNKLYNNISTLPYNKTGLLLGSNKFVQGGLTNLYYKYRIDAAVMAFNSKKIDFILVSGDNSNVLYDEPTTIKSDLIAKGIPEDKIFLDYAGFRTFDSVYRSKAIFGQTSITIISQPFHNQRAVYIAEKIGIKAVALNARDVSGKGGLKTQIRERMARIKMVIDIWTGQKPRFLGNPIEIK